MDKPRLPKELEQKLPEDVVRYLYTFVPRPTKPKPPSPSYQYWVEKLQQSPKRTAMDLYGFEDFVLR